MDALYTGTKIAELRKQKGMTQREFAQMLHVTDKAVSKWERGLNFPELLTLEKIAELCQVSVLEILGLENSSGEHVASEIAIIAYHEKEKILKNIYIKGWITIVLGVIVIINLIYVSKLLADNHLFGVYQMSTLGMIGFIMTMAGNGVDSILNIRKLRKMQ